MDHLPFHRIIEIFKRQKIILAASTVNGWFSDSVDLLRLLYETLKKEVLSSDYIQIDESTIPVMDKDHPGSTKKGYHWIVRSPMQNQLFFHYQNGSRAQRVVVELLHPFQGAVQSDAYGAYDIYENKKGVLLLGCMAHGRRKFEIALKDDPDRAKYALGIFRDLYAIERDAKERDLSHDAIKQLREEKSYPKLKDFEKWLLENYSAVLPKSLIGKAISYTYNIYPRLARYVLDGRYNIDNNGAENGVRSLALSRKGWLFAGSHEAAENIAMFYSFFATCKNYDIDPQKWLTHVIQNINDTKNSEVKYLLPQFIDKNLLR